MVATCHIRGHLAFSEDGETWLYKDTGKPIADDRACPRCSKMPTPEGCDACLGYIPGVEAACCGHGVAKPYFIYKDDTFNNKEE